MEGNFEKITAILVGVSLLASVGTYVKYAEAQEPMIEFIDIDLSQPPSVNAFDIPFGIECDDPTSVYVTIFNQGLLARIDKNTEAVELINDPEVDPDTGLPPASGQNFYSIERDPNTGNLFTIEQFNGELWRFEPSADSADAWTKVAIVEEVVDTLTDGENNIVYPEGFNERPVRIIVNGNAYLFTTFGNGEVVFANSNIWVALSYFFDFGPDDEEDTGGDKSFTGLAKVDPITLNVERIPIADDPFANVPTGLSLDATEPNIIWITDQPGDKIYKFDTVTETVIQTISDPLIDDPRGIDNDNTNVYVALNKPGVDEDFDFVADNNSEIAQINKSDQTVTIIDTGANLGDPFVGRGTFSVFVGGPDILAWTDQAFEFDPDTFLFVAHVGTVDLITSDVSVSNSETFSNHFGCVPFNGEFWWAGQGSSKVGKLPNSKFNVGVGVGAARPTGRCSSHRWITSETVADSASNVDYTRCGGIDDEPPIITRAFVTPNNHVCVETHDNVFTAKLSYNGNEIPRWSGSGNGVFCTNEELPAVIQVVAEDSAGNKSEMVAINTQSLVTTQTEQRFSAIVSKELNPHHGVEGISMRSDDVIKQIRLARSPELSNERILHFSERAMKELNGERTVIVTYKGPYIDRDGQIYVFGTNRGLLATFDVEVDRNDIRLSLHEEKPRHGTYDLELKESSVVDSMDLNAWQRVELKSIFAGNEDLTLVQKNILSKVVRLTNNL